MTRIKENVKILLVQLFSNGDCLYATAIARQVKKDYPGCHLTWAISRSCQEIIKNNPYIDAILTLDDAPKNDLLAFRRIKKKFEIEKKQGKWNQIFVTQNMDQNQALYDGIIRSGVLNAYPNVVSEGITPVLRLTQEEKKRVIDFAGIHHLEKFQFRILFEFAPQSGQIPISKDFAIELAELLVKNSNIAVILSSALPISHDNKQIIDGSLLSLRETAGLTHFCTHIIGCSSGITWASTSDGAKQLPMIQLINPDTPWINPVSRDFERYNICTDQIIDLVNLKKEHIYECVTAGLVDFRKAKSVYNQVIPLKFITSRKIIYNLLCHLQFKSILNHIRANVKIYGYNLEFYTQVVLAVFGFPIILLQNIIVKQIIKKANNSKN